jgi:monovalent cation:H+ antiporter, CPA1 family
VVADRGNPAEGATVGAFISTETLVIELLLLASLVAIAVRRLRVPYTVALVVVGLVVTARQTLEISLTPELILALLVPPLVFEAAFHLELRELRRSLPIILLMAILGVALSSLLVGGLISLLGGMALPLALVFGALISATDPVAVVALFRALGAPKRLATLVEGEALLNDGTAIVIFNIMLAVALTGQLKPLQSLADFATVSAGGLLVGVALGWLTSLLISRIDDYLIETTLTTVLAFGAYLVAERLHLSGVLAVVAAGLVSGSLGRQGMSPTTRIVLYSFWEYVAFLANTFAFLLIGLDVDVPQLLAHWQAVALAIAVVLFSRAVVTYGLGWLGGRFSEPIPSRWLHVLNWGGLRGAIALALALSLPASLGPERETLRVMAFGVVLFTLIVQSTTMRLLMRGLSIAERSPLQLEYELRHARLMSFRAAVTHLDDLYRDGFLSESAWEALKPQLLQQVQDVAVAMRHMQLRHPALAHEEVERARRELLRAQRSAVADLLRGGIISEHTFDRLSGEIDAALMPVEEALSEDDRDDAASERGNGPSAAEPSADA